MAATLCRIDGNGKIEGANTEKLIFYIDKEEGTWDFHGAQSKIAQKGYGLTIEAAGPSPKRCLI
jgi:hypothetical protein